MVRLPVPIITLAALALSGCTVRSVYPIYTDKDIVAMPEVEGTWRAEHEGDIMSFVRDGDGYVVTVTEADSQLTMSGHFARIGNATYLDLTLADDPINSEAVNKIGPEVAERIAAPFAYFAAPVHYFQQIEVRDKVLRMRAMSASWVKDRRDKGHLWIAHIGDGESTLLTADTQRVQRFLRRWEKCDDAWDSWTEIPLVPAAIPVPAR